MPLKNNYIKLTKKIFKGPYSTIADPAKSKKGLKKSIVSSIMRGSIPAADELLVVARFLGTTIESLLEGPDYDKKDSIGIAEPLAEYHASGEEQEYIEKLQRILREAPDEKRGYMKGMIDAKIRELPDISEEKTRVKKSL